MSRRNPASSSWYLPLVAGTEVVARSQPLASYPVVGLINGLPTLPPWALAGLVLWLDAAALSTIKDTPLGVYRWEDRSGLGNNATQSVDAQRPTVATDAFAPRAISFKD